MWNEYPVWSDGQTKKYCHHTYVRFICDGKWPGNDNISLFVYYISDASYFVCVFFNAITIKFLTLIFFKMKTSISINDCDLGLMVTRCCIGINKKTAVK